MRQSLESLLEGAIDYAGMFPPAKLGLNEAWNSYHALLADDETAWLVGRFVIPANKLSELHPDPQHSAELTVIGRGGASLDEWKCNTAEDAEAIRDFQRRYGESTSIEGFEVRVPSEAWFGQAIGQLRTFPAEDRYVEIAYDEAMPDNLAAIAETEKLFAKARTGGLTADAFPTPEQLALFLREANQLDLPFKLTAGLHHPLPVLDKASGGKMHGFLNVLLASGLCYTHDLTLAEVQGVLETASISAIEFGEESLRFEDFELDLDEIGEARELVHGFGSCSVQEPKEDLRSLGLW